MFLLSLPMRERGLKYGSIDSDIEFKLSLPMRERGLKYVACRHLRSDGRVAPHAGSVD